MPIRKAYGKYVKHVNSNASAAYKATKALAISAATRALLNVEFKSHDTSQTSLPTATAVVYPLSDIAIGDDFSNRDGRSIRAKSLLLQCRAIQHASATKTTVRYVVVQDKENTPGADPAWLDIYDTSSVDAFRDIQQQEGHRFKILMDKVVNFTSTGNGLVFFKKYFKLDHHIKYDGTSGGSSSRGSLWLMTVSNEPTNTPTTVIKSRLRFIDN